MITLGDIIYLLESCKQKSKTVRIGLGEPMSYRGYYDQLAFVPEYNITIAECLHNAKSALGATFEGYKGGEYTMDEGTECWMADYGCSGDGIGTVLLAYMLDTTVEAIADQIAVHDS